MNVCSNAGVAAFEHTVENLVSGFKERVYYTDGAGTEKPPCERTHRDLLPLVAEVVANMPACNRVSGAHYVDSRTGSKRAVYANARANLLGRNIPLGKLASIKYFVKREATYWVKPQVPRIISPRSAEFNLLLGRYLHPQEKVIFDSLRCLTGSVRPVIAKGMTYQEKATVIADNMAEYGCCIGLDASRFDQCINAELLKAEHSLYTGIYNGDRTLRALLKCQFNNSGVGVCQDGMVTAKVGPMRCSGDVNTSLGNCIITALLATLCLRELGIVGTFFADGDDCLLFIHRAAIGRLAQLSSWYLRWGIRMKVEAPAFEPEQVEFCQGRPVLTGSGWTMARNWTKALNTDGYTYIPMTENQRLAHIRSVGLCGLSMAAGIPILQPWYQRLVECGRTGKFDANALKGMGYQHRIQTRAGHLAKCQPITDEARVSFWAAFGVCPAQQLVIEKQIGLGEYGRQVVSEITYFTDLKGPKTEQLAFSIQSN